MPGKKVLFISTTDFVGGGETFLLNTISPMDIDADFIVAAGALRESLAKSGRSAILFESGSFRGRIKEIKTALKRAPYDAVVFNGGNSLFMAPFISHPNKILYRHTTYEAYGLMPKRMLAKLLTEISTLSCNKIVHVSGYSLKQQLLCRSKGVVVYHGLKSVSTDKKICHSPMRVLYIGRLEEAKGIDIIIDAFKDPRLKSMNLTVVGDGDMADFVNQSQSDNISYAGYQTDTGAYYSQCDVFITMPRFEAFGLTVLEAMSYGLPVVAPPTGGIPEIVTNNTNGMIVDRNKEEIIATLLTIGENPQMWRAMSDAALHTARQFSITQTREKIKALL